MLRRVAGSASDTWSGASYERIAETFAPIHDRVVGALAIEPGARVVDVACGTGGVALRAARAGADVTGIDISADQLAKARRAAEAEGLRIRFDEGDCQELPYGDAEFGAVASAFGAIFAPDHERAAAELARVCKPGGRFALTAWPKDEWSDVSEPGGRSLRAPTRATGRGRSAFAASSAMRSTSSCRPANGASRRTRARSSGSSSPRRCPRCGPGSRSRATRCARAEQIYLDQLASGVLARDYVLVLGTRR